jgi:beta-fructofuranosidase
MTFQLDDHWVWDFWLADDGDTFHMFYLHAPKSLVDPELRHRNARIGHAVSRDLVRWDDLGVVLGPGGTDDFDATATWTGSVVRGEDGLWRMFYTGARFLPDGRNIESIGLATSPDLGTWTKRASLVIGADERWYERLGDSSWPEEAWRDPWVYRDADGDGWHMLITARAKKGAVDDRGVIGHATSPDLITWTVCPPLSAPGAGFMHLEVPQLLDHGGSQLLVFSCDTPKLSLARQESGVVGGIWAVDVDPGSARFEIASAELLAPDDIYAGRLMRTRDGALCLIAFTMNDHGSFGGAISDPLPVVWPPAGATTAATEQVFDEKEAAG